MRIDACLVGPFIVSLAPSANQLMRHCVSPVLSTTLCHSMHFEISKLISASEATMKIGRY
jgi:hypothetical protein